MFLEIMRILKKIILYGMNKLAKVNWFTPIGIWVFWNSILTMLSQEELQNIRITRIAVISTVRNAQIVTRGALDVLNGSRLSRQTPTVWTKMELFV